MRTFAIAGGLAALSGTAFVYALMSIGAATSQARTASAFLLGPAYFFSDSPLHPVGVVILVVFATYIEHIAYWWIVMVEDWPAKLSKRISILFMVHFGSAVGFLFKHALEQMR